MTHEQAIRMLADIVRRDAALMSYKTREEAEAVAVAANLLLGTKLRVICMTSPSPHRHGANEYMLSDDDLHTV